MRFCLRLAVGVSLLAVAGCWQVSLEQIEEFTDNLVDRIGDGGDNNVTVVVEDGQPEEKPTSLRFIADGLLVNGEPHQPDQPIYLVTGQIVKIDAGKFLTGGRPPLRLEWRDDEGRGLSRETVLVWQFDAVGPVKITLRAIDADGVLITQVLKIVVRAAPPPEEPPAELVVQIVKPVTNSQFEVGEQVTLEGRVVGGVPPYQHHWALSSGEESDKPSAVFTLAKAGNIVVTYVVTDAAKTAIKATATIIVTKPPPDEPGRFMAYIAAPAEDDVFRVGKMVIFTAEAIGGVGPFSYFWQLPDTHIERSTESSFQHTFAVPVQNGLVALVITDLGTDPPNESQAAFIHIVVDP